MTAAQDTKSAVVNTAVGSQPSPAGRITLNFLVILLMAFWLIPTIGLLVNSFRPAADVANSGWWTGLLSPTNLTLDNYREVLGQSGLIDAFINSLFITIPSTIIPLFVAAFAAYAFAWMSFPFRNVLFVAVVGLLVIPLQTTLIPSCGCSATLGSGLVPVGLAGHTAYGLLSRSTCSGTSWARCPRRSSSPPRSMGQIPRSRSSGWRSR
jgi:alpha-glucoside transport system permease protein